jgi:hypothetical protein
VSGQAFNHFAAIIHGQRSLASRHKKLGEYWATTGCLGVGAVLLFIATLFVPGAIWLAILQTAWFLAAVAGGVMRAKRQQKPTGESAWFLAFSSHPGGAELLDELIFFAAQGRLNERAHPELRRLLEQGARALHHIEASGQAETIRVAREALVDCIWTGRSLFQRKGGRQATFQARCADPDYGRAALESIGRITADLEALAANLHGESAGSGFDRAPLQRTLRALEERRKAEAELPSSVLEEWSD